jgi:hypothetical protein
VFFYYGRKGQLGKRYPAPTRRTVIEPFAGSAAYAHRHIDAIDAVILVERDEQVCGMWRQILNPDLDVDDLCPPLGLGEFTTNRFHVTAAVSGGGQTQAIGGRLKATPIAVVNVERLRRRIDYPVLGAWCKDRQGQVIVCEGADADWLPFEPLADVTAYGGKRSAEVVWYSGGDAAHGRLPFD